MLFGHRIEKVALVSVQTRFFECMVPNWNINGTALKWGLRVGRLKESWTALMWVYFSFPIDGYIVVRKPSSSLRPILLLWNHPVKRASKYVLRALHCRHLRLTRMEDALVGWDRLF